MGQKKPQGPKVERDKRQHRRRGLPGKPEPIGDGPGQGRSPPVMAPKDHRPGLGLPAGDGLAQIVKEDGPVEIHRRPGFGSDPSAQPGQVRRRIGKEGLQARQGLKGVIQNVEVVVTVLKTSPQRGHLGEQGEQELNVGHPPDLGGRRAGGEELFKLRLNPLAGRPSDPRFQVADGV